MRSGLEATFLACIASLALAVGGCGDSGGDGDDDGGDSSGPGGITGQGVEAMCADACDCEKCDDDAHDRCVEEASNAESYAKDAGCDDELDAIEKCIADHAACDDGRFRLTGQCEEEVDAIHECTDGAVTADDGDRPLDKD